MKVKAVREREGDGNEGPKGRKGKATFVSLFKKQTNGPIVLCQTFQSAKVK
ncbi:hypothetical protein LR48_Vigan09g037100 [Vigna angularis]|uniref:Uncharacterized protein n=1 Tax=Phaseolus angularis TaxID=3914 RepID=A0A0L9V9Y5_PHAAN|nr:hypothetical protein LR48_Vigan09g037100 [Vigna angularis]